MVSYEYLFKLIDSKLTRRNVNCADSSMPSAVKDSKINKKSDSETSKHEVKVDSKVQFNLWISSVFKFFQICTLVVLLVALFYLLPWESLVFSEEELQRLSEESDLEYQNFLATVDDNIDQISIHEVPCQEKAYWREIRLGSFVERCGLMVVDDLLPKDQMTQLQKLSKKVLDAVGDMSYGNRESINLQWVNLHNLFKRNLTRSILTKRDFGLIKKASEVARDAISEAFGIAEEKLFFNMVSQFTRYRPLVKHTEFRHVDKARSPALIFTSILWLSTSGLDFGGGHTEFLNGPGSEPYSPVAVEPKLGRFAAWTSGFENPHEVKEVYWGNRYALIFAFTVSNKLGQASMDEMRNWAVNASASDLKQSNK